MEKLSIEEKAKRYDEAIEVIRKCETDKYGRVIGIKPSDVFPEFVESEDERIRKELIAFVKSRLAGFPQCEKYLTWLEKQGEQKASNEVEPKFHKGDVMRTLQEAADNITRGLPVVTYIDKEYYRCTNELIAIKDQDDYEYPPINVKHNLTDKVEPKFKDGDWVVFNNKHQSIYQVEKIEDGYYILRHTHGGTFRVCVLHDGSLRLWTIQDAKEGDVLASHECLVLFREIDGLNIRCYCTYHFMNNQSFYADTLQNKDAFHPATKEERNLLFAKMKEAGYEWDEIKKPVWSEEHIKRLDKE